MADKKTYVYEHYEDIRAELGVIVRLDDAIEFNFDGEHSIEKYLARLEARKKAEAEKTKS